MENTDTIIRDMLAALRKAHDLSLNAQSWLPLLTVEVSLLHAAVQNMAEHLKVPGFPSSPEKLSAIRKKMLRQLLETSNDDKPTE